MSKIKFLVPVIDAVDVGSARRKNKKNTNTIEACLGKMYFFDQIWRLIDISF